ncbi:hypothetical protein CBL_14442 [Carabus blaptoides fortunei]
MARGSKNFNMAQVIPDDLVLTWLNDSKIIIKPIVKDPVLLNKLESHSSGVHVFICMYSQEIWSSLEEFYWENEIDYVEGLKSERLFIPAGVLLYTMTCHREKLGENYPIARNAVITYTTIHSFNYKLLVTLISKFGNLANVY